MDAYDFIEEVASSAPAPGGGGASAYCGALAAALASMVGNLTLGKKRYVDVESEVEGTLGRLTILRSRLLALIDADAEAFAPLAAAYGLPHATEAESAERVRAIAEASIEATRVPLDIMTACIDVLHECDFLARHGSRLAVSDAGASAALGKAALLAASLNVYINLGSMDGMPEVERFRSEADSMIAEGSALADEIYNYVASQIEAPLIG